MMDPFPEDGPTLPEGVTESDVEAVVREIIKSLEKFGIYVDPNVAIDTLCGDLRLHAMADIGDLAFAKRVQDPAQEEMDTMFHRMETDATRDRVEDIKKRFMGDGTDRPGPEPEL